MRAFEINELKTIKKVSIRKNLRTIFLADYKICGQNIQVPQMFLSE
jgi:hypothetical protein